MNVITEVSPVDKYRVQVLPPDRAHDLWTSLPSHIKPAVFERNLTNALMANPDLMQYDPRLIFREVSKAAGLGLLLDPLLGEGYIVPAYNYKSKKVEPQLRVGYKGMCKLARQAGDVVNIYSHEIHSLDHVECDLGFPKVFHHKPKLFSDRGPIIGYVAVIAFKDGNFDFEPMSVEQCHGIRDRSDAWKAFKEGKIKSTPWATDDVEMSKKTVMRRLMKRQEQSPELAEAIRIEDHAEFPEMDRLALPQIPRDSGPPRISAPVDTAETKEPDNMEADIVETAPTMSKAEREAAYKIIGGTYATWTDKYIAKIEACTEIPHVFEWITANQAQLDKLAGGSEDNFKRQRLAVEAHLSALRNTPEAHPEAQVGKPKRKYTRKEKASDLGVKDPPVDFDGQLAWIDATLAAITDPAELETVFNDKCQGLVDTMMPPDQEEAMALFAKHERRLGGD